MYMYVYMYAHIHHIHSGRVDAVIYTGLGIAKVERYYWNGQ